MNTNSKNSFKVPEPCHEDWNLMSPQTNGRFCGSCNKVVTDFSKMSNEEILAFLTSHQQERVCGRFHHSQLEKPSTPKNSFTANSHFPRGLATLFFTSMMLWLTACKQAVQSKIPIALPHAKDSAQQEEIRRDENLLGEVATVQIDTILPEESLDVKERVTKKCTTESRAEEPSLVVGKIILHKPDSISIQEPDFVTGAPEIENE